MAAFGEFRWNIDEFQRIRKSEGMQAVLKAKADDWVPRCNADLHAAQARRNQPVADGYDYNITTGGTRARLYIIAYTARAMAHEAVNHTILKTMQVGKVPPPNHEVPRELARRSDASRNLDVQGQRIHRLDG